jgi:hypothetical protein
MSLQDVGCGLSSGMAGKTAEQARKERLARQLRENLKRRKAQLRSRAAKSAPSAEKP